MLNTPLFRLLATLALLLGTVAAGIYGASHLTLALQLPYRDPARLVVSSGTVPFSPTRSNPPSFDYQAWKSKTASFDAMAGFHTQNFHLQAPSGETERVKGSRVSAEFFPLLNSQPLLGRVFSAEDAAANSRLVVLSHEFWKRNFSSARSAIGQDLWLDGASYRVAGVMPAGFWFLSRQVQFWVLLPSRPNYFVSAVGRLKPGATVESAQAEAQELERAITGRQQIRLVRLADLTAAATKAARAVTLSACLVVLLIGLIYAIPILRSENPLRTRLAAALRAWLFFLLKALGGLLPLAAGWLFLAGRVAPADVEPNSWLAAVVVSWPFFLATCAVVAWAVLDQRSRCPLCLSWLRMPIEIGSWANLWVNRPGTEYICPFGHGKLYVPGAKRVGAGGGQRWTSYRDIWQSLFAK